MVVVDKETSAYHRVEWWWVLYSRKGERTTGVRVSIVPRPPEEQMRSTGGCRTVVVLCRSGDEAIDSVGGGCRSRGRDRAWATVSQRLVVVAGEERETHQARWAHYQRPKRGGGKEKGWEKMSGGAFGC